VSHLAIVDFDNRETLISQFDILHGDDARRKGEGEKSAYNNQSKR